jgi:hypothetical protein
LISQQEYSWLDRLTHRLAFLNPGVQLAAADVEKALFSSEYENVEVAGPVFVTSLPRAGTTLVLEILSRSRELATQRYRDMPFVLTPILWQKISGRFRRSGPRKERAHGDGMQVSFDSPEAFEEIVWKAFWPERYRRDSIPLWGEADLDDDFRVFFSRHLRKVIAVHGDGSAETPRYLSKNNANIGRLGVLKRLFPDAVLLIPFRDPIQQAASMLRQHLRFLEIHRHESFTRTYMRDLGHLEFGALHRPLSFPGLESVRGQWAPESLGYWIGYWIIAFRHVLSSPEEVSLLSYERLCRSGEAGLRRLGDEIGLRAAHDPVFADTVLKEPRDHPVDLADCERHQVQEARELFEGLSRRAIF